MNNFKFYYILLLFKGCLIKQKLEVSTSSGSKDTNLGTYCIFWNSALYFVRPLYSWARSENGGAHCRFPLLPPGWAPAASQHTALTKVKLPTFRTRDSHSWFPLVESTFNRSGIADTRLRFDLVLPALLEEVIEQLRGILHTAMTSPTPTGPSRPSCWHASPRSHWISARDSSTVVSSVTGVLGSS